MSDEVVPGSCLCGAVQFEVTLPVKANVHCHCSMCRKAHGAAFATFANAYPSGFRFTAGEAQVPLSQVADIRFAMGPPFVRSESGQVVAFVFVDVADDVEPAT